MTIQINTDKTINGDEKHTDYYKSQVSAALEQYESNLTRIELHLKDVNGKKKGWNDIQCLLEARLEGRKPIAVSDQADTVEQAMSGALDKMQAALKTVLGRIQNY